MVSNPTSVMLNPIESVRRLVRGAAHPRRLSSGPVHETREDFFVSFDDLLAGEEAKKRGSAALISIVVHNGDDFARAKLLECIQEPLDERDTIAALAEGHFYVVRPGVSNRGGRESLRKIGTNLCRGPLKGEVPEMGFAYDDAPICSADELLELAIEDQRPFRETASSVSLARLASGAASSLSWL